MTTKPKARKFRIRRNGPGQDQGIDNVADGVGANISGVPDKTSDTIATPQTLTLANANLSSPATVAAETDIDAIRQEGLTGRQLRMARRVAQKNGLAVTSDFDAVRQLRLSGIDPFQRSTILELVVPGSAGNGLLPMVGENGETLPQTAGQDFGRIQLPQTVPAGKRNLPSVDVTAPAQRRASEILQIQRDIAKRRKRKLILLFTRLAAFVFLPALLAGWYFYVIATPMYATKTEFVIQQAQASSGLGGGLGGLFQGTSMATQQDSITVQSYLTSRDAMLRLDADYGFKAHFSQPDIDPIQRLSVNGTNEEAFKLYQSHVKISYDPTEGILKMEVVAADPQKSQAFSEALVGYAEERVDQLTQRLREDQMDGALVSYESAETRRAEALQNLLDIQNDVAVIDAPGEIGAVLGQISTLEAQRLQKVLELNTMRSARVPNAGRVSAVENEIAGLEDLISELRQQMTQSGGSGATLASKTTELRLAEENYQFQVVMVQQAQTMMETARLEANRQVRYLSMGVAPTAPDSPTYPRAFENTALAFLIFAGIYLMISLTASILREQVSS